MIADDDWSHLPEPLREMLRELRARSAARVRAEMAEWRRTYNARRWAEVTEAAKEKGG